MCLIREARGNRSMKRLFFNIVAKFRYYSTKSTYHSTKWSSSKNKSRDEEFKTPKRPKIEWTDEQLQVLHAVSSGESVFITGSAGTGKTALMQEVIKRLRKIYGRSRVAVTASTGIAACALNGLTLHSFAGTGIGEEDFDSLLSKVLSDRWACRRWEKVTALVIDECSMINADYFDKLEQIARMVRGEDAVWGGIQLVVGGDFFQLPPVMKKEHVMEKEFVFEADCWNTSFDMQIELTNVFRQSESDLVKLLQAIRRGEIDSGDLKLLHQRGNSALEENPSAVQLFPLIKDVHRVNRQHMLSLGEDIVTYTALDSGQDPWKKQLKLGIAPDQLELCLGARVILCKNIDIKHKLVNGATGTVIDFYDDSDSDEQHPIDPEIEFICESGSLVPVVRFDSGQTLEVGPVVWSVMSEGKVVAKRKQIPLILAWALSIHKSQGMSIDRLRTDLRRAFGYGMVYVALSRVKTLDGLDLAGFHPSKIRAHPKVLQFYEEHFPQGH